MAVHIWCPRASDSAIKIRNAIKASGIKCYKTRADVNLRTTAKFLRRMSSGDLLVNWGPPIPETIPAENMIHVLNNTAWCNKKDQLIKLAIARVPCPEVYDSPGVGRLGRSLRHQGGRDLLNSTGRDYYTQKIELESEVRVHIFKGLCIRVGVKIPERGMDPGDVHPWIRTHEAGWAISYRRHREVTKASRLLAKAAVKALNLDFGAVDIGITSRGIGVVLEVNTAPGLDGGRSVEAYARHIIAYHETLRG